jgi:hypothetical protein
LPGYEQAEVNFEGYERAEVHFEMAAMIVSVTGHMRTRRLLWRDDARSHDRHASLHRWRDDAQVRPQEHDRNRNRGADEGSSHDGSQDGSHDSSHDSHGVADSVADTTKAQVAQVDTTNSVADTTKAQVDTTKGDTKTVFDNDRGDNDRGDNNRGGSSWRMIC